MAGMSIGELTAAVKCQLGFDMSILILLFINTILQANNQISFEI